MTNEEAVESHQREIDDRIEEADKLGSVYFQMASNLPPDGAAHLDYAFKKGWMLVQIIPFQQLYVSYFRKAT